MPHHPPIGVIFDMDGVLVDSAGAHLKSWQRLAAECGGSVTERQFAATFGRQNRDIIPILFGPVPDDRMQALADRKEAIYRDLVRASPPIIDGAVALIDGLCAAGVRLAVGSSGPRRNIELIVEALGAQDRIGVIVSGDDVTRGKPDPQVFALAAERLGVAASRCVVVEDAPVGVQAAKAAGARAVAVLLHHPACAFPEADWVAETLASITVDVLISLATGDDQSTATVR